MTSYAFVAKWEHNKSEKGCLPSHRGPYAAGNPNACGFAINDCGCYRGQFRLRPTPVSKHLAILTECELVAQEQQGREICYHLNPEKMKEIADFVEPFRQLWEARFNQLEEVMKKYQKK